MFGDHVHLRAALQSVLGRVRAHLHVHLGDRVDDGRPAQGSAAATVSAVDAVDVDRLTLPALQTGHRRIEATADRFVVVGQKLHARKNLQKRHRIAAANRKVLHLAGVEHRLMGRLRRCHDFADGADGDRFGQRSDVEPQGRYRKPVVREHDIVAALNRSEAAQLGANGVRAGLQRRKRVKTHLVADGAPHFLGLLIGEDDVGAWDDLILGIDNRA